MDAEDAGSNTAQIDDEAPEEQWQRRRLGDCADDGVQRPYSVREKKEILRGTSAKNQGIGRRLHQDKGAGEYITVGRMILVGNWVLD